MAEEEPSYIDYEAFLDPHFSATSFANTLVRATNNPSDTPLDLSTPLSRVLFDVQEIDTHIDTLTTKSALPLLEYTKNQAEAGDRILLEVEAQVASLTDAYKRLEKEVVERYQTAEEVRVTSERLWQTVKLGRSVARCLLLSRQLDAQMSEFSGQGAGGGKKEDHRAMVRSSNTLLSLGQLFSASGPDEEGEGLDRVNVISSLRSDLITPAERAIISRAQQIVREFSMSSLLASSSTQNQQGAQTTALSFAQTEDTKSRATSALIALYLLSPIARDTTPATFTPSLLISALQSYLQTSLTSSLAALSRALATLPTLDRTLLEISARCQNIVALETLLDSIKPPAHPLFSDSPTATATTQQTSQNLLTPLLSALDTNSLPSYFWRSLASSLAPRVQDIVNRGGVSARTLRSNKERVREATRECVFRGSQLPAGSLVRGKAGKEGAAAGNWEREAAVMVGSVMGVLGR